MKKISNIKGGDTIKNSCGGQGCDLQQYTMPYGIAWEFYEIEGAMAPKPKPKKPTKGKSYN